MLLLMVRTEVLRMVLKWKVLALLRAWLGVLELQQGSGQLVLVTLLEVLRLLCATYVPW